MSLRMIGEVLKLRGIDTHCPLCGRKFGRAIKTVEHIFPGWLQRHHKLQGQQITLPNFIKRNYRSVTIDICSKCNNLRFGQLESVLSKAVRSEDAFQMVAEVSEDEVAVWLGKIIWLLSCKAHAIPDPRTRNHTEPESVVPGMFMPGLTYVGMIERCYAMNKGMRACFLYDPPVPEFFYGAPYSLYLVRIDTRDDRMGSFDFIDNLGTLGVAIRSGSFGAICVFDGGLHRAHRSSRYSHIIGEALHPLQFNELAARIFYDQTVLDPRAFEVTYFWNSHLREVIAQTLVPRRFNPYLEVNHDPVRQSQIIGHYTFTDPEKILAPNGSFFTNLETVDREFLPFAVTEEELADALADPARVSMGPLEMKWRDDPDTWD